MNRYYEDLLSRIVGEPLWWDEHAVPRWCEFAPDQCADIYADEVLLMRIECQSCGTAFRVCMSSSASDRAMRRYYDQAGVAGDQHAGALPGRAGARAGYPLRRPAQRAMLRRGADDELGAA